MASEENEIKLKALHGSRSYFKGLLTKHEKTPAPDNGARTAWDTKKATLDSKLLLLEGDIKFAKEVKDSVHTHNAHIHTHTHMHTQEHTRA